MAAPPRPSLEPEIGPDGLARDSPVLAYTEKVIAEEQLQLKKYIQENYSKIRDVEKELENLTLEVKLTAGPKKAALEHLRKKIEMSTERIRLAKVKEEDAKKAWEAAAQVVKEEEDAKQKLCDDLNRLVQESAASQYSRLEELKKRLESLNPTRTSVDASGVNTAQQATANSAPQQPTSINPSNVTAPMSNAAEPASSGPQQQRPADAERKRRPSNSGGRGRGGVMILPKGRGSSGSGWTGAGFET
ncbi:uncharacterized protein LOC100821122 isoform X1 [Brachypodium distachyon]|uniref:RAB6-interacting golgin n=1 Tax=Brachypodium distachyon TaxID=15368 RepID=I1I3H8_BRADI|nr:uncharacterized protein LOC100821122 isoform X1 [Brachypodium distachyon]XP_024318013.1 uncharacterized protein LOC100821122 isoform X1 [Brachypodium distachyon]KQJ96404.1 hypothetical protein BRADI_3g22920v3 [Brachypodium distachyon]KQJ96405.1 hypothetical protein BRADI_3g22920v3 [Brachypodium distachyon]|eukprot:XP_010234661.1 uncharacterized protein LOC100821122 isoform X1 [Brachypodium distachyon]